MKKYNDIISNAIKKYEEGNIDDAIALYEDAFKDKIIVEDLLNLGLLYFEKQLYGKALDAFDEIIESFPDFARAYYSKGIVYEEMGLFDQAIDAYLMAIKMKPDYVDAYFYLAGIYEDKNEPDIAFKYYKIGLSIDPNHFWLNLNIGSYYERNNNLDLALQHFLKAYEINCNYKMVCYNLGVVYTRLKMYDKALHFYLKELNKENFFKNTYLNIALLYKDCYKNYELSKLYYLKGIENDKDNYILWYNLGCLYALLKDYKNAYECLLFSVSIDFNIFDYLKTDIELEDFRNSDYYNMLQKEFVG